jgi:hypothetical protein
MKQYLISKINYSGELNATQKNIHNNIVYNKRLLENNFRITTITSIQQYVNREAVMKLEKINGFSQYFNTTQLLRYNNLFDFLKDILPELEAKGEYIGKELFLYQKQCNIDFSNQKKKDQIPRKTKYYYILPLYAEKKGNDVFFVYNYNLLSKEDFDVWTLDNKITLNRANKKHKGFFNQRSFKIVHL